MQQASDLIVRAASPAGSAAVGRLRHATYPALLQAAHGPGSCRLPSSARRDAHVINRRRIHWPGQPGRRGDLVDPPDGGGARGGGRAAAELDRMHSAGVRGVRVNLEVRGVESGRAASEAVRAVAVRVAPRGWGLQVYADMRVIGAVSEQLAALQVPVILDHFAGAKAERGPDQPGMAQVLNLLRTGNAYVKLSAPYRASSDDPFYANLAPIAQAFFAANPERLIWASDWPHTGGARSRNPGSVEVVKPFQAVDDRRALNAIVESASDDRARRALLVDNPPLLYGF